MNLIKQFAKTLGLVLLSVIAVQVSAQVAVASSAPEQKELETVPFVDLQKYLGKWYEIASFPQWFQKGCTGTTATYSLKDNGKIKVVNECFRDKLDGKKSTANGTAEVVDKETNAKLKVWFFWPFKGDYWVIDLGANYEYAVVGHPDRDYLWILSRTPQIEDQVYNQILERIKAKGYDLAPLQKTLQKTLQPTP